jgi:hypothetical protein
MTGMTGMTCTTCMTGMTGKTGKTCLTCKTYYCPIPLHLWESPASPSMSFSTLQEVSVMA